MPSRLFHSVMVGRAALPPPSGSVHRSAKSDGPAENHRVIASRNDRGNRDPVLFAEGAAVVFSCTRERHAGRSLRINSTLRIFKLFFGIKHEIIFPERM